MKVPLIRPNAVPLSRLSKELKQIEDSGQLSNYGPINTSLEQAFIQEMFDCQGECVTVCNATIGLMLMFRQAMDAKANPRRRYVLMPSFTFAAAPQAAIMLGLTPLLCDIDPLTWMPSANSEERLIQHYGHEIAVVAPYATFGNCLDMARYAALTVKHGIPVVVDAAASLGSRCAAGRQFGVGSAIPTIYSMHATKSFSVGEAGLIYSDDSSLIETFRAMGNFGFGLPRTATMAGLNSKISEVTALKALYRLHQFQGLVTWRTQVADWYREYLPDFQFQVSTCSQQASQFIPVLLPADLAAQRSLVIARMGEAGVQVGAYFSPHVAEQPYLADRSVTGPLPTTTNVASRIISLPVSDFITHDEVAYVCSSLKGVVHNLGRSSVTFFNRK